MFIKLCYTFINVNIPIMRYFVMADRLLLRGVATLRQNCLGLNYKQQGKKASNKREKAENEQIFISHYKIY